MPCVDRSRSSRSSLPMRKKGRPICGPTLATGLPGKPWCIRVASVATSAVPSNNAAALPATISATARGAPTSPMIADKSDFSSVLAQTSAANAKPPYMSDPLGWSHTASAKPSATTNSSASTNATGTKSAGQSISGTMPDITDPKPAAIAQSTNSSQARPPSVNAKKASPPINAQSSSAPPQKQNATSTPLIRGMQTGPISYEPTNPMPAQNDGTAGATDASPGIVLPDPGQAANQNVVDAPNPPGSQTSKSSTGNGSNPELASETPAALQGALLDALASGAPTPTSDPTPKNVATSQPSDKTSNTTQLNALMQSLQPSAHRETSAPAALAQTPPPQSGANQAAQPASAQNQGSDSGNSSGGHSHGEQTRNSSDGSSSQAAQQSPDSAAMAPPTSSATSSGTIANPAADSTGGISAAAATQNSGTSSAILHVAPASQANVQAAPPDINALAINIAAKSQAGAKQFDISLEPTELGRVEVRLTVDSAGNAQAHLVAERPETLQMLQRDSGTLSHALKESGVQLGDNGLQFSLKGQERQGDGAQQGASRAKPLALSAVTSAQNILPISSSYGLAFSQAGIDIRV